MPSCWRRYVLAAIAAAAVHVPVPAWAQSCEQLWHARNSIFAAAGHCFKTPRAIAVFGSRCHPPYGRLTGAQQARVNSIIAQERQLGCDGESSGQDAQVPLPPPPSPPDTRQGAGAPDPRLSEAASVWAATKDSNSPAVLEAFVSRFGDTPFGDLARARLDEVKKAAAATPPQPQTEARKPPAPKAEPEASGEMCPKYLPSVGRTVQAPCEH
jgi:YARHG domain-containing protein